MPGSFLVPLVAPDDFCYDKIMKTDEKDFAKTLSKNEDLQPVGVWYRLLANIIDGMILGIISLPLMVPTLAIIFKNMVDVIETGGEFMYTRGESLTIGFLSLGSAVIGVLYYTFLTSSKLQGSLGKRLLGYKVVNYDGSRVRTGTAFKRYMVFAALSLPTAILNGSQNKVVSAIVSILGLLNFTYIIVSASLAAGDPGKRMIHDRVARTLVVQR